MERLSGVDAAFLYMETPVQHMHGVGVTIFDPSGIPGGYDYHAARAEFEAGLTALRGKLGPTHVEVRAAEVGMAPAQVLISCKVSGVQDLIAIYTELARRCDYPLHLGLTEAGMGTKGTVASATALAVTLLSRKRLSLMVSVGAVRTGQVSKNL